VVAVSLYQSGQSLVELQLGQSCRPTYSSGFAGLHNCQLARHHAQSRSKAKHSNSAVWGGLQRCSCNCGRTDRPSLDKQLRQLRRGSHVHLTSKGRSASSRIISCSFLPMLSCHPLSSHPKTQQPGPAKSVSQSVLFQATSTLNYLIKFFETIGQTSSLSPLSR
jgi:hypothetical protein